MTPHCQWPRLQYQFRSNSGQVPYCVIIPLSSALCQELSRYFLPSVEPRYSEEPIFCLVRPCELSDRVCDSEHDGLLRWNLSLCGMVHSTKHTRCLSQKSVRQINPVHSQRPFLCRILFPYSLWTYSTLMITFRVTCQSYAFHYLTF